MYQALLSLHSIVRWLLLTGLVFTIFNSALGWHKHNPYSDKDRLFRQVTTFIALLQLLLGLCIYFTSPIITYFLQNYKEAVHQRAVRFFGMEHSLMMLVGIAILLIGNRMSKRQPLDHLKHKMLFLWYAAVLIILLINIPWPFSPFAARPLFRPF